MVAYVRIGLLWLNNLLVVLAILSLLRSTKSPASTIAWILALLTLPYAGLLGYVIFGIEWRGRRIGRFILEEVFSELLHTEEGGLKSEPLHYHAGEKAGEGRNIRILQHITALPIYRNNLVQSFYNGQGKFEALFTDIATAQHSIDMEYYHWSSDSLGTQLMEALASRAREGVQVRLLFDSVGSFGTISFAYRRHLREAGISYAYFLDLANPLARIKINYRNHRKIVIIDGRLAYVGGINVGDTYLNGGKRFRSWRDTHLRIEGPAVHAVQCTFLVDWYNSTGDYKKKRQQRSGKDARHTLVREDIPKEILKMRPSLRSGIAALPSSHGMTVQIALGGPDSPWEGILMHYCELISSAEREVLIQTPYFIPSEALEQTMITAALRGVNVKLMTMGTPSDHTFLYWIAQTYFPKLLRAGVEIYQYQRGLMHAKVLIKDRGICSIGSCNMDQRSFHLAYEFNAVIYSEDESQRQAQQFHYDIEGCRRLSLDDYRRMPPLVQLRNAVMRIMAPIM